MAVENLHPDLSEYVFGDMIDHPLVVYPVSMDVSSINRLYLQKRRDAADAENRGDWGQYVALHERPYRVDALLRALEGGVSNQPSEYWKLVGAVWQESENISQCLYEWSQLWGAAIECRRACMSEEDLQSFESLPKHIDVWRGVSCEDGIEGLSWTLDRDKG